MQIVLNDDDFECRRSLDYHVRVQTDVGRAALFTTGTTCFEVLYQLSKRPGYIEPIREEIMQTAEDSMDRINATNLVKLDSFIRECQRWCPLVQRASTGFESCTYHDLLLANV